MVATRKLWLEPDELVALVERLEAEQEAARDLDERILAAWAEQDAREQLAA